jgi:4-hydroxy-2-oxoheptanedioate aldolase
MEKNTTKSKLLAGETVMGCLVRYHDPGLAEFLGYQGWDFFLFDAEHGTLEPRDCEHLVRAAELRRVTPLVRVTTNQQHIILRFLDIGAQGVQVPMVNSAAEAESAVRAIKFSPRGARGLAGTRPAQFGHAVPLGDYVQTANAETIVIVQVETVQAVAHVSEIARIDGVDVVFVGPTDLSLSLGVPGQPQHPRVHEAAEKIAAEVKRAGKILGAFASSPESAREWRNLGARYLVNSLESILSSGVRQYLDQVGA